MFSFVLVMPCLPKINFDLEKKKKKKKKKGLMRVVRVLTKRETCLTPQKDMLYYEKDSVVLQIG